MTSTDITPRGRFAPSPSGRMHLGNVYSALLSWLSVKSKGGKWVLRIEDLDPQRSKADYARLIEDDLQWLGLEWDEGGLEGKGNAGPYVQSWRHDIYERYLQILVDKGLIYSCRCRRADIMATQAPHQSDGRVIYAGTCRPAQEPPFQAPLDEGSKRIFVPDRDIRFTDSNYGAQCYNLARDCGDFIVRRADGAWAYQLAVVVDDGLMGMTEVVRGSDLLLSTAQQIYLYELFGFKTPDFTHLPLLCNDAGQRLSKRDAGIDMGYLREHYSPEGLLGKIGQLAGLLPESRPVSLIELLSLYQSLREKR